ncbi:hypothetical protein CEXT_473211 [Caerostris extrusa]|uniref:Uncharacterized protein n=1 Tax=Caerostris extrusa TaxID=172846 RepID=A0AAV4S384_CAEEX|nr:hypothetical protein CEXT_473211 [Caerostris extrusa]
MRYRLQGMFDSCPLQTFSLNYHSLPSTPCTTFPKCPGKVLRTTTSSFCDKKEDTQKDCPPLSGFRCFRTARSSLLNVQLNGRTHAPDILVTVAVHFPQVVSRKLRDVTTSTPLSFIALLFPGFQMLDKEWGGRGKKESPGMGRKSIPLTNPPK